MKGRLTLVGNTFVSKSRSVGCYDRSLSGGVTPVKLTDAELEERMEKMRILNAAKREKHRLQEADKAAFESSRKITKNRNSENLGAQQSDAENSGTDKSEFERPTAECFCFRKLIVEEISTKKEKLKQGNFTF